ncbi:MAG: universal stress protein [Nitrospirota bacterium]|nr:MAG: universal stress protein [Nitrospirota bacterium]
MENLVHRIIFATDFSACSFKAFEYALAWANFFEAQLTIVHVVRNYASLDIEEAIVYVNIEEQIQGSRERLEKTVSWGKAYAPNIHSELLLGIPADQVCQFAQDNQGDLIIMGAHGWSGLDRVLMGSVAERVICQAPCPVLIIPAREDRSFDWVDLPETMKIEMPSVTAGHLLLPIDFSDCSLAAFEYGTRLAKSCDMSVSLFHVVEPLSYSLDFNLAHPIEDKQLRHKVEARLSELTGVLKKEDLRADYRLADKPAVDAILEGIHTTEANLVVMGTHGRRGFSRLVMGSITAGVLRRSSAPILTVKSPKFHHEGSHHA